MHGEMIKIRIKTCCFVPCGKLTPACVLIAVMANWNRSNNFDTSCTFCQISLKFSRSSLAWWYHYLYHSIVRIYTINFLTFFGLPQSQTLQGSKPIRFKQLNQQDATVSQVYYLTFMCGSTCFGAFPPPIIRSILPDHDQQRCYRHAPKVKPEAANAVVSSSWWAR
jgi:hypothetical protein